MNIHSAVNIHSTTVNCHCQVEAIGRNCVKFNSQFDDDDSRWIVSAGEKLTALSEAWKAAGWEGFGYDVDAPEAQLPPQA